MCIVVEKPSMTYFFAYPNMFSLCDIKTSYANTKMQLIYSLM